MTYQPKYQITDSLLGTITQIESLRTQIDSSYILPEREIEMRYRATVEEIHSSTAIEGNPLSMRQVEGALANKPALTRHQYAEIEVRNYKKALDFIEKRKSTSKPINMDDILAIHGIITRNLLPEEKTGKLRDVGVDIVDQYDTVLYKAPSTDILVHEIAELLNWINNSSDIHPVIAAAVLHYQFVSIHPFADGNGRTTRVLTHLYLGLRGYDFRNSLVLDSYYLADKQAYYDALHRVQGSNYLQAVSSTLGSWIKYFAEGFLSAAKVLLAEVTILSSIVKPEDQSKQISSEDADLLNYAKQFGSINLAEAQDILPNTPRRTLQRRLNSLVNRGYVTLSERARNARYTWNSYEEGE